jgi:guanylate kinase
MQTGHLIVLTGPSGVGKGTLLREFLLLHPEIYLSISATTRKPRPGEVDGKDYHFLDRQSFETTIEKGEFLEWAEYAGNYYGTPKTRVTEQLNCGKSVILEIELVGARSIKQAFPDALSIFILPPSLAELERRLQDRGKDSLAVISQRLERAKEEIAASEEFDVQIVNDDLTSALQAIEKAILA